MYYVLKAQATGKRLQATGDGLLFRSIMNDRGCIEVVPEEKIVNKGVNMNLLVKL